MTIRLLGTFRRSAQTPRKANVESFRKEIVSTLRAGRGSLAGETKDSIMFVNNLARAENYEMLLAIHRCLDQNNSVLSIIRAANEMRDLGYRNGQDMLTSESLAARQKVHSAIADSGLLALDARRLGALVVAKPHHTELVLSIIESRECRNYLAVVELVGDLA